jgi:hypothetical protein
MSVTYFVRGGGANWVVIELHTDNREEIVADGLSPIEAEILCVMEIENIPRPAPPAGEPQVDDHPKKSGAGSSMGVEVPISAPPRAPQRQERSARRNFPVYGYFRCGSIRSAGVSYT